MTMRIKGVFIFSFHRNLHVKRSFLFIIIILGLLIYYGFSGLKKKDFESLTFELNSTFNNVTGYTTAIIPNIIHFIIFSSKTINFVTFLCISTALKIQQPERIIIHCDCTELSGHYWLLLVDLAEKNKIPLQLSYFIQPTHVFGQPLSSVYHSADVARILILMKYGGIYLDTDTILIKPLHQFLHYEMVIGWPLDDYIGCQILIGHKNARFLKLWLEGYKRYKPRLWYYNAGQYPTQQILMHNPGLIHRVPLLFGVHNLLDKLYVQFDWPEWKTFFSIHLLSRHPPAPIFVNETTILNDNTVFGQICRWSLFDVEPILDSLHNMWVDVS